MRWEDNQEDEDKETDKEHEVQLSPRCEAITGALREPKSNFFCSFYCIPVQFQLFDWLDMGTSAAGARLQVTRSFGPQCRRVQLTQVAQVVTRLQMRLFMNI